MVTIDCTQITDGSCDHSMDLGVACKTHQEIVELAINLTQIENFTTPTAPSQNCCNTSATQNNTQLVTQGGVVTPTAPSQINGNISATLNNTQLVAPEGEVDTTVLGAVIGVLGVLLLALALIGCIIASCFIIRRRKSTTYNVTDHNQWKTNTPQAKPANFTPVRDEASKRGDDFYVTEEYTYSVLNAEHKKTKTESAAGGGEWEGSPMYDTAMSGETLWGVTEEEYSKLKH